MNLLDQPNLKLGSHVSMRGKDMFLNSVKEAVSYQADTFMVYTGAPQNTRRKPIEELNLEAGHALMKEAHIQEFIVHAPYIINPANSIKADTFQLAVEFLALELQRTEAMGSRFLILHPGSHVGAGTKTGIAKTVECLNEVLSEPGDCVIALETMSGKGSEIGASFEELAAIYDGVVHNERLRICFDTCHVHDAGYDIVHDLDGVFTQFDRLLGLSQLAVMHINDSKNPLGARKDRHANIGAGYIGFHALCRIVHHPALTDRIKILETPYIPLPDNPSVTVPPYREEIARLRAGIDFHTSL